MNWSNILISGLIGAAVGAVDYFISKRTSKTISILVIIAICLSIYWFKPYFSNSLEASRLEAKYKENELFNTISKKHPKEFTDFIDQCKTSIRNNEPPGTIDSNATSLIRRVLNKHLNTASDEAIVKLITAQRDMYQALLKEHPAAVAKFELNQLDDSLFDLEDLYSGFLNQIQKVEAEVILSENTAKSPIDATLAKKKLASIYSNLKKKFGEQNVFLAFSFPNSLPPATSAEIIVSYYQALLDSGKENTALIIKYTMAT